MKTKYLKTAVWTWAVLCLVRALFRQEERNVLLMEAIQKQQHALKLNDKVLGILVEAMCQEEVHWSPQLIRAKIAEIGVDAEFDALTRDL